MARREGRDRLAPVVEDLLAVDDQDRVAAQEVADLLAEPQRMDRHLVVAHGLLGLETLLRVDALQPVDPRAIAALVELALRLGRQLLQDGAGIAEDRHVRRTVVAELGRIDVDLDDLHVRGPARRAPELDDVVEPGADVQDDVGLGEGPGAGEEEREPVVLGDGPARERRRVEGDSRRLDEGLERRAGVRPPHAAPGDEQRPLGPREQRDRLRNGRGIAVGPGRGPPVRRHRDG